MTSVLPTRRAGEREPYQRDRAVLPVALSHAVLGTTYFAWVRGRELSLALLPAP